MAQDRNFFCQRSLFKIEEGKHLLLQKDGSNQEIWNRLQKVRIGFGDKRWGRGEGDVAFCKASALWADAFYKLICTYVCVCVCLVTFEVPFKCIFAPTSRSGMSKIFRDSESLGKSNGKKWSQI